MYVSFDLFFLEYFHMYICEWDFQIDLLEFGNPKKRDLIKTLTDEHLLVYKFINILMLLLLLSLLLRKNNIFHLHLCIWQTFLFKATLHLRFTFFFIIIFYFLFFSNPLPWHCIMQFCLSYRNTLQFIQNKTKDIMPNSPIQCHLT